MVELARLTALELLEGYRERAFSPLEALEALLGRIERLNPSLGAFVALCPERARVEAAAASARYLRREPRGPLDGVPLGVKDLYDTEEIPSAYGSRIFAGHLPERDAEAVALARAAGAVVVGKTQTHEFAWGITSVNEATGSARNPWERSRIAGGSSGGSAVALAAGLVPLALGTDTGGSIRIPSAFCGTVGLKPTYGRVPTAGVFPLAPSLDHAGPMARTPLDTALLLSVIAGGGEPLDSRRRPDGPALGEGGLEGLRVGIPPELEPVALAPAVRSALERVRELVPSLGGSLVEVELPEAREATTAYASIQPAEALATHERLGLYPARAGDYGADVRGWLELATAVGLGEVLAATAARERLRAGFERVFSEVDLLLGAVSPTSPPLLDAETIVHQGAPRTLRELVLGFTVPQDLAGLPACTLRAGFDEHGCPVGVQLTGAPMCERTVLRAADALYRASAETQSSWPEVEPHTQA